MTTEMKPARWHLRKLLSYFRCSCSRKSKRPALLIVALLCPLTVAWAQDEASVFASESMALLDLEHPRMNAAVAQGDRTYFGPALGRVRAFLDSWEGRRSGAAFERNSACRDAVTDFLIVGLCKIPSPDPICEPATFFPKAERNIEQCREMAAQISARPPKESNRADAATALQGRD